MSNILTDWERVVKNYLVNNMSDHYSKIGEWFDSKVVLHVKYGHRLLVAVTKENVLAGNMILKRHSIPMRRTMKICSMYVSPDSRGQGIGAYMLSVARVHAFIETIERIYFTAPHSLDCTFFKKRGFLDIEDLGTEKVWVADLPKFISPPGPVVPYGTVAITIGGLRRV